jgi:hypothetical protein
MRGSAGSGAADHSGRVFARWVVIVTIGELVGFGIPAAVGVLTVDSPFAVPLLMSAGAIEGALLGSAQWLAMAPRLSSVRPVIWIALTASGAAFAYGLGMLPSALSPVWTAWQPAIQVLFFTVLAALLLLSIGGAQWFELRHRITGAWRWVLGSAVGWAAGLGAFFAIAAPLWHAGQSFTAALAVGLIAGTAMALVMALTTGVTLLVVTRSADAQRLLETSPMISS